MEKKEQARNYIGAFQPHLWDLIENRLNITHLNQHPNEPYPITDVYNATMSILQGSYHRGKRNFQYSMTPTTTTSPDPVVASRMNPEPAIKVENFGAIMLEFTKTVTDLLSQSRGHGSYGNSGRNVDCNVCGGPHYIRDCGVVDEYVAVGKCRRNIEGKVVLSTRAYVPREIPGMLLKEWIDEWHCRNPGQLAAVTLITPLKS